MYVSRRVTSATLHACLASSAGLLCCLPSALSDTPTVAEMDSYVAQRSAEDLEIWSDLLHSPQLQQLWVAPGASITGAGTKSSPLDLLAVLNSQPSKVKPGTIVWLSAGVYNVGEAMQNQTVKGTRNQPVVFRAEPAVEWGPPVSGTIAWGPPVRATINGTIFSTHTNDHIWWWGVEVTDVGGSTPQGQRLTASGVATTTAAGGGNDVKFINLFIHDKYPHTPGPPEPKEPTAQGIGGGDDNDDCEFYGNIIFRNGWTNLDHGFYTQVTAAHTTKRWVDNVVFENSGEGFQIYGSAPILRNIYYEGNVAFSTSMLTDRNPALQPQMNVLIGGNYGTKNLTCVIVRNSFTYHPDPAAKRGVDIGYKNHNNSLILVENNYFTCVPRAIPAHLLLFVLPGLHRSGNCCATGSLAEARSNVFCVALLHGRGSCCWSHSGGVHAMELNHAASDVTVRNNTFWAPDGMVTVSLDPPGHVVFEQNRYIENNGSFSLDALRKQISSGSTDRMVPGGAGGRPAGLQVFTRVNRYEPNRVHVIVYNWEHTPTVKLDLGAVLGDHQRFSIIEARNLYSAPAFTGTWVKGGTVDVAMPTNAQSGHGEFACFVLFREQNPTE